MSNESKNEKLNSLFCEMKEKDWHKNQIFIPDGIINEEEFDRSNPKILFLNKEAYTNEDDFDLRIHLNKPAKELSDMWIRVGAIAYCIFNTIKNAKTFPAWIDATQEANWYNSLQKVATMNIKKSNGKSTSDDNDLWIYAQNDAEDLKKQIKIIEPDIIICGGVGSIVKDKDIKILEFEDRIFEGIYDYENANLFSKKVIIADHFHPASRYGIASYYYTFAAIWFKYLTEYQK